MQKSGGYTIDKTPKKSIPNTSFLRFSLVSPLLNFYSISLTTYKQSVYRLNRLFSYDYSLFMGGKSAAPNDILWEVDIQSVRPSINRLTHPKVTNQVSNPGKIYQQKLSINCFQLS
jgi:hypothetical protein